MDSRILILGCGKMGGAILSGWLAAGWSTEQICVVEAFDQTRAVWQDKGVTAVSNLSEIPADFVPTIILVAVKPQGIADALPELTKLVADRCSIKPMVLSILAGTTIATYEKALGADTPVLRVMPNTPVAVGRGVCGLFANSVMTQELKDLGASLMQTVGEVTWLANEDLMHAVTAVSGSGPAYVFHMVEAMAAAGEKLGLDADAAMALARQTMIGSAELLRQSEESAEQLRVNVCSPGGTTIESIKVMMREVNSLTALMTEALAANAKRSRELS